MMTHPYRGGAESNASPAPSVPACPFCRARSALARISRRTLLFYAGALLFLGVHVTTAFVSYRCLRNATRVLASADSLEKATRTTLSRYERARDEKRPAPPPARPPPPKVVPEAAREPGIVRAGPAEFEVDGDLLRKALEGGLERVGQPRLLPEHENGQVKGIRVFGVTHDTLLGILGIEDGDSIRSVNGFDMTRPESALEAYARLRTASDLTVKVSRHGSIVTMHYHLI